MGPTSIEDLHELVEEQAALHRVAALVAREHRAEDVFAVVVEEVGLLLDAHAACLFRHEDGEPTMLSCWRRDGETGPPVPETGPGVAAAPVVVEGREWGRMIAYSTESDPLPQGTAARIASFTELVATAIANEEARDELAASRARIVAAADEARRQIERNLHDGIQQRLVALSLDLVRIRSMLEAGSEVDPELVEVGSDLDVTLRDLHEIAHGIHPAILSKGGLGPALRDLARRAALPVEIEANVDERLPEPVEVAAYYVVSEALTNAAKHAEASCVWIDARTADGTLHLTVRDDGCGGADTSGSGLTGLIDRVEALGGTFVLTTVADEGTSIVVELPGRRLSPDARRT